MEPTTLHGYIWRQNILLFPGKPKIIKRHTRTGQRAIAGVHKYIFTWPAWQDRNETAHNWHSVLSPLIPKTALARLVCWSNFVAVYVTHSSRLQYMSSYMADFGFNEKMLRTFKCQGGLVVDEMKLSEHLSVSTAGKARYRKEMWLIASEAQRSSCTGKFVLIHLLSTRGRWSIVAMRATGNA